MIQYAPIMASTVPAFADNKVIIYFTHNDAVAASSITKMYLMIKNISDGKIIDGAPLNTSGDKIHLTEGWVEFDISSTISNQLKQGQYYKFQIAYDDGSGASNAIYSSAAIGKYLGSTTPELTISILDDKKTLKGKLTNNSNLTTLGENLYSYQFIITKDGSVIENSKEILCAPGTIDTVQYKTFNELNDTYNIIAKITTINGYVINKESTVPITQPTALPNGDFKIKATNNYDNGYIKIQIYNNATITTSKDINYIIERYNVNEGYKQIASYKINSNTPATGIIINLNDFSVAHGLSYKYSIRTTTSARVSTEEIVPYFEDTFLTDEHRQLKIRFNPKISSLKDNILEQKTDTIGGKYPFIFRNGQVRYKEIPISGLISYLEDEDQRFMSANELGVLTGVTNLTDENIAAERKFKIEVLNWLNNGEPKLFRSPTEGNYIVRLMSVSLSPNDTLGRMLHTFSATGYEIMDSNQTIVEWRPHNEHRLGV